MVSALASYLIPLISIVMAFVVSHWFWLGLLYFIVGSRITTRVWCSGILRAALSSEQAFCLLFYTSKVNCYDHTTKTEYEWQLIRKGT